MSETLTLRKGIVQLGRNSGQDLVAMHVTQLFIDRILAGKADALEVSDIAEKLGCSRAEVIDALVTLETAGLITSANESTWQNVNALAPTMISIQVTTEHGLPFDGDNAVQLTIAPTIERKQVHHRDGKEFHVEVEPQSHDGETLYYYCVTQDGAALTNGTRDTEDEAWMAVQQFLGPENSTAPTKAKPVKPTAKPRTTRKKRPPTK